MVISTCRFWQKSLFTFSFITTCVAFGALDAQANPASSEELVFNSGCYSYDIEVLSGGRERQASLVSKDGASNSCLEDKLQDAYADAFRNYTVSALSFDSSGNSTQQTISKDHRQYDDDGNHVDIETDTVFALEFIKKLESLLGGPEGSLAPSYDQFSWVVEGEDDEGRTINSNDDTFEVTYDDGNTATHQATYYQTNDTQGSDQVAGNYNVDNFEAIASYDTGGNSPFDRVMFSQENLQFTCSAACNCTVNNHATTCEEGSITLRTAYSPISLVWVPGASKAVVSNFPLEAGKADLWYIWEASATRPLVVHDADKSGKITRAEQLLGNNTKGQKFADGFEALKSFDKNNDGAVAGNELAELSLWFDKNANGASDAGEVQDIQQAGVTRLFYLGSRLTADGNLELAVGYERKDNEKLVKGESIDWHSKAYGSYEQAAAALQLKTQFAKKNAEKEKAKENLDPVLSGVWQWEVDKDGKIEGNGINKGTFALLADKSGKLAGSSLIEIPVTDKSGKKMSMIRGGAVAGSVTTTADGKQVTFKVQSKDGQITETTAKLMGEGKILKGSSRSYVEKDGKKSADGSHYTWTAKRFKPEKSKA